MPAPLLILSTAYVTPKGRDPYFEVIAAPDAGRDAPRWYCWTTDESVYRRAVDVEGTAIRVALVTAPTRGGWRELKDLTCL